MSFADYWRQSPLRPVYIGGIALLLICASFLIFWLQSKYSGVRDQSAPQQSASGNSQDQSRPTPSINQPATQQGAETVSDNGDGPEKEVVHDRRALPSTSAPHAPSEIIVSLVDGGQAVTLDRRGHLTGFEGMAVPIQRAVRQALSAKDIKKPEALDELSAPGITLLGQSSNALPFALLAPTGKVILDDRPAFNWQPLPGATNYTISVFDSDFNRVLRSEPQAVTNWSPPAPLKRGRIYFWEVTALKDGQEITSPVAPAPRAQFKIVDEETAREINQVKNTRPDSHLALGILYTRAGLLADAEREFQLLVNANPRSEVARTLLNRVRSWKRP